MAAVVIATQPALDEGTVDSGRLEQLAAAGQWRVRRVGAGPADLMVVKAGSTLPFLLWHSTAGGGSDAEQGARIVKLASTFKRVHVLIPYERLADLAVLDEVARLSADSESLTFVWMPMGAAFTERALALAQALLPAEAEETAWRKQQAQVVATSEAVNQALMGLPLPPDGDTAHHANMLRMLGSIQDISQRQADEIAALTDLGGHTAAGIAAFFQRGGPKLAVAPGLGLPPQLQSL